MDIVALSMAGFNIYWYGIVIALALLLTCLSVKVVTLCYRVDFELYLDVMILAVPLGLIMARLFFVIGHWQLYSQEFGKILALSEGGLSIYGAFTGFFLTAYLYTAGRQYPLGRMLDLFTPPAVIGLAVVQSGNFVLQSVVGRPTEYFRLVEYIEFAFRPAGFEGYEYFIPVALYQTGWLLFVLATVIVLHLKKRFNDFDGTITLYALMLILAGRFLLGFLYLSGQTGWCINTTSLLWLILVICIWLWRRRQLGCRIGKYTLRI